MGSPNIIFIMADDMGWGDLGCYGATKIPTPNMDQLARQGMRFTDAHSSSAVCSPSRYSVVTGRYCWRSRLQSSVLYGFGAPLIEPERMTVASLLRKHSYATAAVGKWHLGLEWPTKGGTFLSDVADTDDWNLDGFDLDYSKPIERGPTTLGFDYNFSIAGSLDMPPYCFIENDHTVGIPSEEKDPYNPQQRPGFMTQGWRDEDVDTTFAAKADGFMERHVDQRPGEPFFLYLTPSAPHRPCMPPDFAKGRGQAGPRGDMVCVVDWLVGEVMNTLDRLGVGDNTLLIVTSDNGARPADVDGNTYGHKSCGDWRGFKADIWDGGHREPFIARWPARIKPGTACDETICLADLMTTAAAIVGAELPDDAGEDSYNVLPALLGEKLDAPIREAVVHHSCFGMFSIRQGAWKLILGLGSGGFSQPNQVEPEPAGPQGQLYNLDDDPSETHNLWLERPEIVARLTALLEKYQADGRSRPA